MANSTLKSPSTEGKKTGRPRKVVRRMTAGTHRIWSGAKAPARVDWSSHPERTDRLLDYLDGHRDVAGQLFGDHTQAAKQTAKDTKSAYSKVAYHVFSHDNEVAVQEDVRVRRRKYEKAVKSYIYKLKRRYRAANERIDKTSAGLKPEDVVPGSEVANLIELEMKNPEWWSRLHRLLDPV